MKKSFVVILLSISITALIITGNRIVDRNYDNGTDKEVTLTIKSLGKTTEQVYLFEGTAIDLLNKDHQVKDFFNLRCIDDVCADTSYLWNFYVNGKREIGPGSYIIKEGDKIEFRFSKWNE